MRLCRGLGAWCAWLGLGARLGWLLRRLSLSLRLHHRRRLHLGPVRRPDNPGRSNLCR